jgi:hypothetical protein
MDRPMILGESRKRVNLADLNGTPFPMKVNCEDETARP